ncbi:hypothetical protein PPNK14_41050 [Pectobacterium parmentieri]
MSSSKNIGQSSVSKRCVVCSKWPAVAGISGARTTISDDVAHVKHSVTQNSDMLLSDYNIKTIVDSIKEPT